MYVCVCLCVCHILFIHLPINKCVDSFHVLVIKINAAMNVEMQIFLWDPPSEL